MSIASVCFHLAPPNELARKVINGLITCGSPNRIHERTIPFGAIATFDASLADSLVEVYEFLLHMHMQQVVISSTVLPHEQLHAVQQSICNEFINNFETKKVIGADPHVFILYVSKQSLGRILLAKQLCKGDRKRNTVVAIDEAYMLYKKT